MMKPFATFLLAMILSLSLAGCGDGDVAPAVTEADRRAGAELHPQLLAEFGGAFPGDEAAYLAQLGEKVAIAAGLESQCTFTLVNSDVVNAFAVPGCYIYLTRGLMGIVNSEAELASVLAHEMGHITAAHSRLQQRRSLWRGLGVLAVQLITESEALTRIAGEAAGYFTLRYSRKQEYQADDLGLTYLGRAGFDPHAASDMLGALARQEAFLARTRGRDEARGIPEWARTHPLTESRIARARQAVVATGFGPDAISENELAYLSAVDGLLFGDDPAQGFVIGRRFAHPLIGIGFEAPEGFTLTNSPQAILIEGPGGLRGEFGGGRMEGGLEDYASALLRGLLGDMPGKMGAAQRTEVNGVPALFVPVTIETEEGTIALSLAAYAGRGTAAFHFLMIANPTEAPDQAINSLFRSFRLLGPQEVASLRPRHIQVIRAGSGDNVDTLAARMASDHPLDHFLMLNARTAGDRIRPGEPVKIVAYSSR